MSEYVKQARDMALWLISKEMVGAGDTSGAMRRVARKSGVSYGALWSLRYRPPADVLASVYFALKSAHEATVAREHQKFEHERKLSEAAGRANAPLVRAATSLAGPKASGSE